MSPRRPVVGVAAALAGSLAACDRPTPTRGPAPAPVAAPIAAPAPEPPSSEAALHRTPPASSALDPAATAINGFAVDLYQRLAGTPGDLLVSPASITVAFAMTYLGARGETAEEHARVFRYAGRDTPERLAEALARWTAPRRTGEVALANRLFGERTLAMHAAYLERTRAVFGAPLEQVDFRGAPDASRAHINQWVKAQTRDRIVDLLPGDAVRADTRLVLVNAVYFKDVWQSPFRKDATAPGTFHAPGGPRPVPMMRKTETLRLGVVADAGLRVLELPYQGGLFSLVVVLPDAVDGLPAVERALTADALARWTAALRPQQVALELPRFKIEPGEPLRLARTLAAMGMATTFSGLRANFGGISDEPLVVAEAYHKAFVAVDEEGTEAAAATAIAMAPGGPPPRPTAFVVDRPFLFLIRESATGAILFLGRLTAPKA
jgi:serpin B